MDAPTTLVVSVHSHAFRVLMERPAASLPVGAVIQRPFYVFASRRRHTIYWRDWSSDVCSSDLSNSEGGKVLWGHFMLDRPNPGFIAVGKDGNRFTNEAASYHSFTLGMFNAGAIPAFLIADAASTKKYGVGLILPGSGSKTLKRFEKSGYLYSGGTLQELAGKIGVNPAGLERTVKRVNQFAATGVDEDFGKGSTAYNTYKGDPTHTPNANLGPIEKGPFYAVKLEPGDFGTSRGL